MKLKVLDLFSGIGMFSLGLERTGCFETVDGRVNSWMDRLKEIGNSVVPQIVEMIGMSICMCEVENARAS